MPVVPATIDLRRLLPDGPRRASDVRPLLAAVPDAEEPQPRWAPNVVVGLGRLGGRTTGVVDDSNSNTRGVMAERSAAVSGRPCQRMTYRPPHSRSTRR
nr:carboxyl transferase domain-containing protein [Frankia sp. CiP3]